MFVEVLLSHLHFPSAAEVRETSHGSKCFMSCLYMRTQDRFARKIMRFDGIPRSDSVRVEARIWDGVVILRGDVFNNWIELD